MVKFEFSSGLNLFILTMSRRYNSLLNWKTNPQKHFDNKKQNVTGQRYLSDIETVAKFVKSQDASKVDNATWWNQICMVFSSITDERLSRNYHIFWMQNAKIFSCYNENKHSKFTPNVYFSLTICSPLWAMGI